MKFILAVIATLVMSGCSMFKSDEATVEDQVKDLDRAHALVVVVGNEWIDYLVARGHNWQPVAHQLNAALAVITDFKRKLLADGKVDLTDLSEALGTLRDSAETYITSLFDSGEIEQEDFDRMVRRLESISAIVGSLL